VEVRKICKLIRTLVQSYAKLYRKERSKKRMMSFQLMKDLTRSSSRILTTSNSSNSKTLLMMLIEKKLSL
jgi:hypothetical protein